MQEMQKTQAWSLCREDPLEEDPGLWSRLPLRTTPWDTPLNWRTHHQAHTVRDWVVVGYIFMGDATSQSLRIDFKVSFKHIDFLFQVWSRCFQTQSQKACLKHRLIKELAPSLLPRMMRTSCLALQVAWRWWNSKLVRWSQKEGGKEQLKFSKY